MNNQTWLALGAAFYVASAGSFLAYYKNRNSSNLSHLELPEPSEVKASMGSKRRIPFRGKGGD